MYHMEVHSCVCNSFKVYDQSGDFSYTLYAYILIFNTHFCFSVVLVTQKNGNTCMDIVMGHAVKSLVISSSNVCTSQGEIFPSVSVNISKEEEEARKKKIRSWLCKNRIPVEENGELLIVKDALQIYPPYGKDQCLSGNEIILGRVQDLIATMPDNIDM